MQHYCTSGSLWLVANKDGTGVVDCDMKKPVSGHLQAVVEAWELFKDNLKEEATICATTTSKIMQ
jgi:hypothetical protein